MWTDDPDKDKPLYSNREQRRQLGKQYRRPKWHIFPRSFYK